MKRLIFLTAIVVAWTAAMAVPAKPGVRAVTMPDGTTLQTAVVGDEWHHSNITADGFTITQADDGFFYYQTPEGTSKVRAHDAASRDGDELAFLDKNKEQLNLHALYEAKSQSGKLRSRAPQGPAKAAEVPTSGSPKIPVLLIQYSNVSMKHTKAQFEQHYNTQTWSVLKYFTDQSNGAFTPQFDIYGIYTLPNNRSYYGGNDRYGDDQRIGQMVADAISQAGNAVDWSQYDNNGDGEVDACIVVYAGPGEASGAAAETIWPAQWYLSSSDYGNYVTRNNKRIDKFAVFCELYGNSDSGTTLDGIGTFCHEFSHCLGLPDFYPTDYSNHFGMGSWSVMHGGCDNNNGNRPCSYTAYERNFMGWMNLSTPTEGQTYTIATVDAGGPAYKITSNNANEYYVIENIQKTGWNQYAPASGLQVTHVNYNATYWNGNTVNNHNAQGMTIIPADNSLKTIYSGGYYFTDSSDEVGDMYPYSGNNKLTSNSTPAATLYNSSTNLNKPITDITNNSNNTVSFTYMAADAPAEEETGGTASDAYLDIAKYATIDVAGLNNTAKQYVDKIYTYTEYGDVAWLTMPVFGAWAGCRYPQSSGVNNGPQKWITSSVTSSVGNNATSAMGTGTWNSSDIFLGSGEYFSTSQTPRFFGTGRTQTNSNSTSRTITFQVTNVSAIKLMGMNNNITLNNYPTRLQVYECQKNADGTLTQLSNTPITGGDLSSTAQNTAVNFSVTNLDPTKYYKVVATAVRSRLYEIGFQTPIGPELKATPSLLTMRAGVGETKTATFNVKGKKLASNVTITKNDASGVFTVSPTSISIADAESASGVDVTVTFSSQTEGDYTGTLTLTSGTLSETVDLTGKCGEFGNAHSDFLDIQKYETIAETDWYSADYGPKPYEFTLSQSEASGWLTIPTYMAYGALADDNQYWLGGNWSNMNLYTDSWNATDVFKGSAHYLDNNGASLGSSGITASGSTTFAYMYFLVTNCTQAKALCYNIDPTSQYPTVMEIYDFTDVEDFTNDNYVEGWQNNTTSSRVVLQSSNNLDPNKVYAVVIQGYRCSFEEMAFRTPLAVPETPINLEADPASTLADITWTAGANNDDWNLRWRPYVEPTLETKLWDFPYPNGYEEQLDEGWGVYNAGEGDGWDLYYANSGQTKLCWSSASYDNNGSYTPDAWLFTPNITLGGTLRFKAWNLDPNYLDNMGVFICTNPDFTSLSEFVQLGSDFVPASHGDSYIDGAQTYEFDLSDFAGTGVIAFRHYNCTDMNCLFVGDIEVTYPSGEAQPAWNYVYDLEDTEHTITGLTPETTYEVQVQGVNDIGASDWTASTLFTTLPLASGTLAQMVTDSDLSLGMEYAFDYTNAADDYLLAVKMSEDGKTLFCKDNGKYANPVSKGTGQIDYLLEDETINIVYELPESYDQSNWVALTLTGDLEFNIQMVGCYLNNVTGRIVSLDNPQLQLSAVPEPGDAVSTPYLDGTPNVFIPSSFGATTTQVIGTNTFFFMPPKPMEVARVTWALWNGEYFTEIPKTGTMNPYGLTGAFTVNNKYLTLAPSLEVGDAYTFVAAIVRNNVAPSGARRNVKDVNDPSGLYEVYPLTNPESIGTASGGTVTGITNVTVNGKEVKEVRYIDVTGRVSKTPWHGVNIVETLYKDGSKSSKKVRF